MKQKVYWKPTMRVVRLQQRTQLLSASNPDVRGGGTLGSGWNDSGGDAWNGSSSSGSGNRLGGGWTDNGGDAWE